MPLKFISLDCSPLLLDNEIEITDEKLLAELIANVILGEYLHAKKILDSEDLSEHTDPPNEIIDYAISKLKSPEKIKRDGWILQIISWIALNKEYAGKEFYCQTPHDAPAQHGIDNLVIVLDKNKINRIIIAEDKCTKNQRTIINKEVWPEFKGFEEGQQDHKLVSRISTMIGFLDSGKIFSKNKNDIYNKDFRVYRVGINRKTSHNDLKKRKKLFKGYDSCVSGLDNKRRTASTFLKDDIRKWMTSLSELIIDVLESKKI